METDLFISKMLKTTASVAAVIFIGLCLHPSLFTAFSAGFSFSILAMLFTLSAKQLLAKLDTETSSCSIDDKQCQKTLHLQATNSYHYTFGWVLYFLQFYLRVIIYSIYIFILLFVVQITSRAFLGKLQTTFSVLGSSSASLEHIQSIFSTQLVNSILSRPNFHAFMFLVGLVSTPVVANVIIRTNYFEKKENTEFIKNRSLLVLKFVCMFTIMSYLGFGILLIFTI
jgi:predicted transposase YbfD/YdcC